MRWSRWAQLVVSLLTGLTVLGHPAATPIAVPLPATQRAAPAPPAGFRYVGLGHVAIAVPASWPNGFVTCSAQSHGVVVIDFPGTRVCEGVYPTVASVTITALNDTDTSTWSTGSDGRLREPTTCHGTGAEHLCEGGLGLHDADGDGAAFVVRSPRGPSYVDRLISRVRTFRSELAVPPWVVTQTTTGPDASAYVALLRSSGFYVRTVVVRGHRPGSIVSVKPAVGTMLDPGATVTVTRARRGPDEAPRGYQYVGIGRAVIAAPATWPIEHQFCGDDEIVMDIDGPPCFPTEAPDKARISVVHVYPGERFDHQHPGTVDGVRVYYTPVRHQTETMSGTTTWSATAYVPSAHGTFDVSSTTSAAQVRTLLGGLHILKHRVAVPFVVPSDGQPQLTVGKMVKALRALGLYADLELAPGTNRGSPVSSLSPAGGLIADRGTTVTVHTRPPPS